MKKKLVIVTTLIIIFLALILNLRKIYEVFPESIKISIKDRMISAYSNFNDKTKIIIRALNLEPFELYKERYQLNNPKIANLNNDYNVKILARNTKWKF